MRFYRYNCNIDATQSFAKKMLVGQQIYLFTNKYNQFMYFYDIKNWKK